MIGVDIAPTDTVAQVKHKIFLKEKIPPNQQQLIFSGLSLADSHVISNYNIQRDSTIHLVIKINPESSPNKAYSGSQVPPTDPNPPQPAYTQSRSTQINDLNTGRIHVSPDPHRHPQPLGSHNLPRFHPSRSSQSELFVVNCLTLSGRNISLNVHSTDSILDIKNRIAEQEGIVLRPGISLYNGNIELEDTKTLNHYNIVSVTNLRMHIVPKNVCTLFIKTLNGKTFILYPPEDSKVSDIKTELAEKSGIPALQQRLVYQGQDLANQRTLAQCNVPIQCTLHVIQTNPPTASASKSSFPLLIKTFTGKTITVFAPPGGTVRDLKETINDKEGCPVDEIVIMLGGDELEDERILDHHQVQQGSTLLVTFKPKEKLKLSVFNTVRSKMMCIEDVNVTDSISQIEHRLSLQISMPKYLITLVHNGMILGKHHTVKQCNLNNDSVLHLYMPQPQELTITVQTVAGLKCSVTISSFHSVADLKASVENILGVLSNEQVLLYRGNYLDNSAYISDFVISNNRTVYLFLRRGLNRNIVLKQPGNKVVRLQIPVDTSVAHLKSIIGTNEHISSNRVTACYNGVELESFYTLGDYLVPEGAELNVILHLEDVFTISIQPTNSNHKLFTLRVDSQDSVGVFKLRVATYMKVPVNRLSLSCCGVYLLDNCLIRECNLPTVCVVLAEESD